MEPDRTISCAWPIRRATFPRRMPLERARRLSDCRSGHADLARSLPHAETRSCGVRSAGGHPDGAEGQSVRPGGASATLHCVSLLNGHVDAGVVEALSEAEKTLFDATPLRSHTQRKPLTRERAAVRGIQRSCNAAVSRVWSSPHALQCDTVLRH